LDNINLTENERKNNFKIDCIKIDDFERAVSEVKNNNPIETNRIIAKEILISYEYLKKYLDELKF